FLRYVIAILVITQLATAQEAAKKYGTINFSGVLYSFYYYNLNNTQPIENSFPQERAEPLANGYNQFDIERIYFTLKSQLSASTAFQVTTDIYRNAAYPQSAGAPTVYYTRDTNGNVQKITIPGSAAPTSFYNGLAIRLKFGYFDWNPIDSITFRMGMQPTPWFSLLDKAWGYRGVQQTASDKNQFLSAADLGASVSWNFPNKYGSLTGYVFNGNGYIAPEANRFKDVSAKVELNPMPDDSVWKGLKIAGYGYWGVNSIAPNNDYPIETYGGLERNIYGGFVGYTYGLLNVGVEYDINKTGVSVSSNGGFMNVDSSNTASVFSAFASVKGPGDLHDWSLIGRIDLYNPTNADLSALTAAQYNNTNTKNTFVLAGVAYSLSKQVQLAIDYQATSFAQPIAVQYDNANKVTNDSRIFIHGIVTY
ncbi:MAG TPA: hypothetical protein VFJ29_07565, partial [Candidatus Kapabacteria bacterium]|nr:hypothetical protein [Candidatus Kapabacteria bacterium]